MRCKSQRTLGLSIVISTRINYPIGEKTDTYEQMEEVIHILMDDERKQEEKLRKRIKTFPTRLLNLRVSYVSVSGEKSLLRRMSCFH